MRELAYRNWMQDLRRLYEELANTTERPQLDVHESVMTNALPIIGEYISSARRHELQLPAVLARIGGELRFKIEGDKAALYTNPYNVTRSPTLPAGVRTLCSRKTDSCSEPL